MNSAQFILLIGQHREMLDAFAFKFTHDIDDAKDLTQDTLVKAFRFYAKFDEGTNFRGWLYTIMRNTFINSCLQRNRKQKCNCHNIGYIDVC
ncbi:RNA polymerase sigma factor [Pedobacter sp. R-06]|uniref:RNA polymerase sigma factor n=1 Tax=Pedobacter sp. R-06 TaxID=3404051 RepID=UPI003CF55625